MHYKDGKERMNFSRFDAFIAALVRKRLWYYSVFIDIKYIFSKNKSIIVILEVDLPWIDLLRLNKSIQLKIKIFRFKLEKK